MRWGCSQWWSCKTGGGGVASLWISSAVLGKTVSVLMFHLSVLLMWVLRSLNESVIVTGSTELCMGGCAFSLWWVLVFWTCWVGGCCHGTKQLLGGFLLTVLVLIVVDYESCYLCVSVCGLWEGEEPGWEDTALGAPVLRVRGWDEILFTLTLWPCYLLHKKLQIQWHMQGSVFILQGPIYRTLKAFIWDKSVMLFWQVPSLF